MSLQHHDKTGLASSVREALMNEADQLIEMVEATEPHARFVGLEIREMADGSARWFAFVHFQSDEGESNYRIVTPALSTSPQWAMDEYGMDEFASELI